MASKTQNRSGGWCCAPELIVALILATTMFRGCSSDAPVPVVVSTVYRSVPSVDVATDSAGKLLLLASTGAVYRGLPNDTTVQLTDSIGRAYYGITSDVSTNIAYVTGYETHRVYKLVLSAANMSTFAGSGNPGSTNGVGTAAQFWRPCGIVHYALTGLLYVAESNDGGSIRKVVVATANVTTVATIGALCYYICITVNGTFLYVTFGNTIAKVSTTLINSVTALAGSTTAGYKDGVGAAAKFYYPQGIALNSDESALVIADCRNSRIRRLELSNNSVTTIAGSSTPGETDGSGLNATFNLPFGAKWHCNQSSKLCGVLVADAESSADTSGAVRFVAIEGPTVTAVMTASLSALSSGTSGTVSLTDALQSVTASDAITSSIAATDTSLNCSRQLSLHATEPSVLDDSIACSPNLSGADLCVLVAPTQTKALSPTEWTMTVPSLPSSQAVVFMLNFTFLSSTVSDPNIASSSWSLLEGIAFSSVLLRAHTSLEASYL